MPTTLTGPVRIRDAGDLYASIPHLMGFHPADSLVLLAMRDDTISLSMRVDLPRPRHRGFLAAQLERPVLDHGASEVILAVVCAPSEQMPEVLPHEQLISTLVDGFGGVGIDVAEAVWLPTFAEGAPWLCYLDIDCRGTLPDPAASALAAATAHAGFVTFESRAALAATLAVDPPGVLEQRSVLLDDLMATSDPPDPGTELWRVRDAIDAVDDRKGPLSDAEVVALARALMATTVRDACLAFAVQSRARSAEQLWLELTRSCPSPERVEPACLLAFFAYLRGDGGLASVALDVADDACTGHPLARLLRAAVSSALPPDELRGLADKAIPDARRLLVRSGRSSSGQSGSSQSSSGRSQS